MVHLFAHRWSEYKDHLRRVEPIDASAHVDEIVGPPITAEDVRGYSLRQAAKKMNFGSPSPRHAPPPVTYDGLTADECLELYTKIQREEEPAFVFNMLTQTNVRRMTDEQLRVARALWGAAMDVKRVTAINERVRRERAEQLVCDDDRWEV